MPSVCNVYEFHKLYPDGSIVRKSNPNAETRRSAVLIAKKS